MQRFLADVEADPDHEVRTAIEARVRVLAERLRDDPEMIAKAEELKHELLSHPEVQAWLQSLWGELKRAILAARRRSATASCAGASGEGLVQRRRAPGHRRPSCRRSSTTGSSGRSPTSSTTTAARSPTSSPTTVERWDSADTSRRIELQVGRDLQFIRINGTVVGGLVGLAIHAVGETLF